MTVQRFLRSHKIFIYINLLNFLFGQTDVESQLYHIPPNSPSVGEAISFEVSIPTDLDVMEAVFFYKMDDQQSYNEKEMVLLGDTWAATISSVPEGEKIEYFFRRGRSIIKKQVIYFLGETEENDITLSHEHTDFIWANPDDALNIVTYQKSKSILNKALLTRKEMLNI